MPFTNQVALVLGAGRGVGREAALALGAAGAFVACFDFSPMHAERTAQAIVAAGGRAKAYSGDVVKKIAFQTVVNAISDDYGEERMDVLVSAIDVAPKAHLLRLDEWDWHRTLDSNLTLPFLAAQVAGRIMQAQGGGTMVFFGAQPDQPDSVAYQAGKQGLLALARHAARVLASAHIRVHLIWPDDETAPPEAVPFATAAQAVGEAAPPTSPGEMARWLAEHPDANGWVLRTS